MERLLLSLSIFVNKNSNERICQYSAAANSISVEGESQENDQNLRKTMKKYQILVKRSR